MSEQAVKAGVMTYAMVMLSFLGLMMIYLIALALGVE